MADKKIMGDAIRRAVVKDEALHLVRGADMWSVKAEEGKEPNEWKSGSLRKCRHIRRIIEAFSGEILELVDGSLIFNDERDSVKNAIMTIVVEGLMPAFEHLKKIRASVTTPLPELNRRQLYEDLREVSGMLTKTCSRKRPYPWDSILAFCSSRTLNLRTA